MRFKVLTLAVLTSAACAAPLHAQLSYVSQSRSVSSQVSAAGSTFGPDQITAPDFSTFDRTVTLTHGGTYPGSASAHQLSSLTPTGISDVSDFTSQRPVAAGTGATYSESSLDVVFTVSGTIPFTLSGLMPASDNIGTGSEQTRKVQLTGPGVAIDLRSPGAINQTGTFTAGQYELIIDGAYADNALHVGQAVPNFNVSLTVPEPASLGLLATLPVLLRRRRRSTRG